MILSQSASKHVELVHSPIPLLQYCYQSSPPASYPATVPYNLYVDGFMLGFGILVDESILIERLHVRTLAGITDESWTRAGLIVPTSVTPDRYGVNLAFLVDSPVSMNQPKRARFLYCMVDQWLYRFNGHCRLVGGPGDYVIVDSDVLSSPRVHTLDAISNVIGKRYRLSQRVPNIAAWTHREPSVCKSAVIGSTSLDGACTRSAPKAKPVARKGFMIGEHKPAWMERPESAGNPVAVAGKVPVRDLLAEREHEKRSRGAATKNHKDAYLSLLSIIWTLDETPHLSAQELALETGLSLNSVRSYLDRDVFAKRVRAGTARTLEYEIGGKNAEIHRALLGKALRLMYQTATYVFYMGVQGSSETLATGAAQAQGCKPDSSDLDSSDVGPRPQGKAGQPFDSTRGGSIHTFDHIDAATLRLQATVAPHDSTRDVLTDIAMLANPCRTDIKPASPRRSAPCLPNHILPLCPLGTDGSKEKSKAVFNKTSSARPKENPCCLYG